MVFSSFEFLLWFLPFCIATYALTKKKYKNTMLLFFSVVFYAYGALEHPSHFVLIMLSVVINWWLGCMIARHRRQRKQYLVVGLVWDFGCLFVYKYLNFVLESFNAISPFDFPLVDLVMPLGISFYTFQIASYLIDVYRGSIEHEKSLINLGTYILFYPQLIAGPIVELADVQQELHNRSFKARDVSEGLQLFIIGLGKKVLLANQLAGLWSDLQGVGFESISTKAAWMGIFAYSLQLYFDFWGYSQMAIGLGRIFGFRFPENFKHPYISVTMTEFWRRWHITLGTWFREYVYIPLGGNRGGTKKTYRNLLVVWLFTGLWHGADWNFVLWGLVLYGLIVLEKAKIGKFLNSHRTIGHLYMVFVTPLTWLIFNVSDLKQLAVYFGRLFGIGGEALFPKDYLNYIDTYGLYFVVGILCATPFVENLYKALRRSRYANMRFLILGGILFASCYCIYRGMNDPFLYFRF